MPRQKPNRDGATGAIRGAKLGVSSLIAAARKGDLAKIREGIAQGLNVNAVTGGVTLTCALGGAAEKGKSEAIKLLLEAGADPNNPLLPKHSTFPLDWAVFSRSAECVRLLLEAGANANRLGWDDQTALDAAKTYNNLPMINLLKKRSAKTGGDVGRPVVTKVLPVVSADDDDSPVVNLSREANQPEFSKFLTKMAKASGVASQTRQNIRGGYSFSMPRLRADKIFDTYCQQARDAGFFLFRSTTSGSDGNHMLILLPTSDSYVAVRGMQTSGANYDLMPSDIIRWLKALEKRQPFILSGIGHDFLEGRFTTELKDVNSLAKDIYKFCPDVVDQGTETVGRLAAALKRMRRLFLWWD
ncbi:MAG: DUF4253 domain-containing protein [Verrucomicrobia bacterium]|nr:DUF4253 domain-containing protein [Verrucomicrobiota bacterium]